VAMGAVSFVFTQHLYEDKWYGWFIVMIVFTLNILFKGLIHGNNLIF